MSSGHIVHICEVEPAHCKGFVLGLCFMQNRGLFELILSGPRHCGPGSFLQRGVKVSVGEHSFEGTVSVHQ